MTFIADGVPQEVAIFNRNLDAAGSVPVSERTILGNYVMDRSDLPLLLDRETSGGSQTYSTGRVDMAVTVLNDYAICQSKVVHTYFAGKSHRIEITFDNYQNQAGVVKRAGYFSSDFTGSFDTSLDGFYFEADGTDYSFNIAKAGTIQKITRADWNIDHLDGANDADNPSGKEVLFDKFTVMAIDFLYLGGTAVRFGFKLGENFYWAHAYEHSNVQTGTIVLTPNQPVRWEIRSTGGAGSAGQICAAVSTEGATNKIGTGASTDFDTLRVQANNVGDTYLLCAVRIDPSSQRGTAVLDLDYSALCTTSDDVVVSIIINPTIAGTALVWNSMHASSNVQYAIGDSVANPSTNTVTNGTPIFRTHIGSRNRQSLANAVATLLPQLGRSIAGVSDVAALCVSPLATGSNTDAYGLINIIEN